MKKKVVIVVVTIIIVMLGLGVYFYNKHTNDTAFDKEYNILSDGSYECDGNNYKYKLILTSEDTENKSSFTVLTNDESLNYQEVEQSILSSEFNEDEPTFVILKWN